MFLKAQPFFNRLKNHVAPLGLWKCSARLFLQRYHPSGVSGLQWYFQVLLHQVDINFKSIPQGFPLDPILATIGRNKAVAELPFGMFSGFFAWFLWMFIHMVRLIGFRNRIIILKT